MSEKHTCPAKVYTGGSYLGHRCGRGAAYEHEGQHFCKTHHPPTVKAKNDARTEKWKAEWRASNEAHDQKKAAQAELERRSDNYEGLLSVVRKLVSAAGRSADAHEFSCMCDDFIEEARDVLKKASKESS